MFEFQVLERFRYRAEECCAEMLTAVLTATELQTLLIMFNLNLRVAQTPGTVWSPLAFDAITAKGIKPLVKWVGLYLLCQECLPVGLG